MLDMQKSSIMKRIHRTVVGNKKAGASVTVGIIVIAIVIGLIFVAWGCGAFENPYWETETAFGKWGEEIIIYYEDGSTDSLKLLQNNLPFTVKYKGKEIVSVGYVLSATAEGEGYDQAEIDYSDFYHDVTYKKDGETVFSDRITRSSESSVKIPLNDDVWHEVTPIIENVKMRMDPDPNTFPAGTYVLSFTHGGTVRYRGLPHPEEWQNAVLPPGKSVTLTVERVVEGWISVTLSSEIEAY